MLLKLIKNSFRNQKKSMALMIVSVAAGTAVAASLITLSLEINGKIADELRSFGANIVIEPKIEGVAYLAGQKRYLAQDDLIKTKTIFWRHNIVGITPVLETRARATVGGVSEDIDLIGTWYRRELPLPGEGKTFTAGAVTTAPWWALQGRWPERADGVVAGVSAAGRLGIRIGDRISIDGAQIEVLGTIETGGVEDQRLFMELEPLQHLKGLEGKISKVEASALTTPMDDFAYRDPRTMSKPEYEKWYCTGYVTSIAKQLEEVFPGSRAKPVWQVAETEGMVLRRLTLLIYFLCLISLLASALGVSTTMIMSMLRRREEIALMKALGADNLAVTRIFLAEGSVIGVAGGVVGYACSLGAVQYIALTVFSTGFEHRMLLLAAAVGSAVLISLLGTLFPIRRALRVKPAVILKGF